MKILSQTQVREADRYTIVNEPIASIDLMERAGLACAGFISSVAKVGCSIAIFAGKGNNGGDGLVIARELLQQGYLVKVFVVGNRLQGTPDFEVNHQRLREIYAKEIIYITDDHLKIDMTECDIVIDALFGSGLDRPVTGVYADVIHKLNTNGKPVIAIDIPSGLFRDHHTNASAGAVTEANMTLALEAPALALMLSCNHHYCGTIKVIPIGLHPTFIQQAASPFSVFTFNDAVKLFHPRTRVAHKGNFGHALLLAGSRDKAGAAILAAKGALRSGAGLLSVYMPDGLSHALHASLPEAMAISDPHNHFITALPPLDGYNAIAAGPGMGTASETAEALKLLLYNAKVPLILDADALNILSKNLEWLKNLPKNSVLTPHPKEFERLAGISANGFEQLEKAIQFSQKHHCYMVLKSAYSAVIDPLGNVSFNLFGNAGLAKGGSGDTLTGIILGLMARGYTLHEAVKLAVFAHGYAADLVAESFGLDAVLASDIADKLGKVWKELEAIA